MYTFSYDSGEVEPRHYKVEWLSLLGAVATALVLLAVAYFINNHDGLQKIAFICIVIAGFIVALCLTALRIHLYVTKKRTKPADNDAPPSYKAAWRSAYYSRRMTETADLVQSVSGTSESPFSDLEPDSPPIMPDHLHTSTHLPSPGCTPDLPPYVTHTTRSQASLSPALPLDHRVQEPRVGSRRTRYYSVDEIYSMKDPPSYDEAMQSIDLSCLQSLKNDDDSEDDE